jgi:para-nitrobenzyl esterase
MDMNSFFRKLINRTFVGGGSGYLPVPSSLMLLLALGGTMFITSCVAPMPNDKALAERFQEAAAQSSTQRTLEGTAWQLVQIMSMDDRVFVPDERSKYTLAFESEGRLIMRADCNRGQGKWSFKEPNQLEFRPLAMTRAMCPPGSLYDRFISDLGYVRSVVFKDGHLFLATMADGAILEFEPM